jgi:sensor histidine kinase regulating citrate/malate metabolism
MTEIDVMDRGEGIGLLNSKKIFLRGFSTRGEGRGFGLAGSRLLAQELGAQLCLTPRELGGTIARLSLPDLSRSIAPWESA